MKYTVMVVFFLLAISIGCSASEPTTPSSSFSDVIERVVPSVVFLSTDEGEGTGFFFGKRGLILTNSHVVGNFSIVQVVLGGHLDVTGRVIGRDEELDVAIIQVDLTGDLPALNLGDSDVLKQGDTVAVIGYSLGSLLGESPSLTKGVVSAIRRFDEFEFIQTDSSVNPGNSGGPLIDENGDVVGIIVATVRRELANDVSLAIPINDVKNILPFLRAGVGIPPTSPPRTIPTPTPATNIKRSTSTRTPSPTNTRIPTVVPTATKHPTPTPRPLPTLWPKPTATKSAKPNTSGSTVYTGDIVSAINVHNEYPDGVTFTVTTRSETEIDEIRFFFRNATASQSSYRLVDFEPGTEVIGESFGCIRVETLKGTRRLANPSSTFW